MHKTKATIVLAVFLMVGLVAAPDGLAAIYKYIDKDGLVNFADDPQTIPAQYRLQAVIVSGELPEPEVKKPQDPAVPTMQTESPAGVSALERATAPPAEAKEKSPFSRRLMLSSIAVVSALLALVILGIIDTDHTKSIKIIRFVILWGAAVFLIYSHTADVVHLFSTMGRSVSDVRQHSEEKGKKAVKAMKELGALFEKVENADSEDPGTTDRRQKE